MSDLIRREDVVEALYEAIRTDLRGIFTDSMSLAIAMARNIPSAESERKWIPVTEALPKEEKRHYWVCTDTGYQCQCRWTNDVYGFGASDRWNWKIFDIPQYQKVVAWMPLPEPWRGE